MMKKKNGNEIWISVKYNAGICDVKNVRNFAIVLRKYQNHYVVLRFIIYVQYFLDMKQNKMIN